MCSGIDANVPESRHAKWQAALAANAVDPRPRISLEEYHAKRTAGPACAAPLAGPRADAAPSSPNEGEGLGDYRARVGLPGTDTGAARLLWWCDGRWTRDEDAAPLRPDEQ